MKKKEIFDLIENKYPGQIKYLPVSNFLFLKNIEEIPEPFHELIASVRSITVENVPALDLDSPNLKYVTVFGTVGKLNLPQKLEGLFFKRPKKLPEWITSTEIHKFGMFDSQFKKLPEIIGKVKARILKIERSNINALPGFLKQMQISKLIIQRSFLKEIPDWIGELPRLFELDLSYNEIRHVSQNLYHQTELHYLKLRNNLIRELPEGIESLEQLRDLEIENNKIQSLPEGLKRLTNLSHLSFKGNPIEEVPFLPVFSKMSSINFNRTKLKYFHYWDNDCSWIADFKVILPNWWDMEECYAGCRLLGMKSDKMKTKRQWQEFEDRMFSDGLDMHQEEEIL